MSFNRWQKLIAARTEKAVVVTCWDAAADDELTDDNRRIEVRAA